MLVTGIAPKGFRPYWFLGYAAAIGLTVILCDFYRQRFFLDLDKRIGPALALRSSLFLKWPYFVLAFRRCHSWELRMPTLLLQKRAGQRPRAASLLLTACVCPACSRARGSSNLYFRRAPPSLLAYVYRDWLFTSDFTSLVGDLYRPSTVSAPDINQGCAGSGTNRSSRSLAGAAWSYRQFQFPDRRAKEFDPLGFRNAFNVASAVLRHME